MPMDVERSLLRVFFGRVGLRLGDSSASLSAFTNLPTYQSVNQPIHHFQDTVMVYHAHGEKLLGFFVGWVIGIEVKGD